MRVEELNSRSTNSSCPACVLVPAFKRITSDDDYFVFEIGEKRGIVFDGSHVERGREGRRIEAEVNGGYK
jgi:KaiC/GvpD/RAD55 family RecA-like ATPase